MSKRFSINVKVSIETNPMTQEFIQTDGTGIILK